jgi:type II secretory pathway pseudopilin PulG
MIRKARGRGFTLVEILIAITILMVGLLGILAVFPAATATLKTIETETYAALIAQSVKSAIEIGMRSSAGTDESGTDYFLYTGPGVPEAAVAPTGIPEKDTESKNTEAVRNYDSFVMLPLKKDVEFVYPKPAGINITGRVPEVEAGVPEIDRVFRLGADLARFVENSEKGRSSGKRQLWEAENDPYQRYSYCFTVKLIPTKKKDSSAPMVYFITIFVYRNFPQKAALEDRRQAVQRKDYRPVYTLWFYLAP